MKYLGVDFGLRRVGLAVSDGSIASPFKTLEVKNFSDAVEKIIQITQKENFSNLIVGLPEGKIGKTVMGFINALKKRGFNVTASDETLSSQQAISDMIAQNIPKEKRKVSDAVAAAIILQQFLDSK